MTDSTVSLPALPSPDPERSRLVDHFKRAYQIIVGVAITLACTKLFPAGFPQWPWDTSAWLFGVFFITIVPIFHGGDRSLDIKYLDSRPQGWLGHAAYVWDVYMLLITAILFVKIAQSIPVPKSAGASLFFTGPAPETPDYFYRWMAVLLFFDVFVLIVDWLKSKALKIEGRKKLSAYLPWIILNGLLGLVCMWAVCRPAFLPSYSEPSVSQIVLALAVVRTFFDYVAGRKFMFP